MTEKDKRPNLIEIEDIQVNLTHPDTEVRLQAIKDLISLQEPDYISLLTDLSHTENDLQIRYEIKKGIGILKKILEMRAKPQGSDFSKNLQKVENALLSDDEEMVNKAFRYVVQYRLKQFLPVLQRVSRKSGSGYQKNLLIQFMLSLGGEVYFDQIVEFLSDPDPRVVSTAIESLESIGNTKALGYVAQLVTHEHNRVQATAMKALYKLGDHSALKLFEKMVESPHVAYRNSAAYALREMRLSKSFPLLLKLCEDSSQAVQEKALEGMEILAANGSEEAMFWLENKKAPEPRPQENEVPQTTEKKIEWIRSCLDSSQCPYDKFLALLETEQDEKVIATLVSSLGRSSKPEACFVVEKFLNHNNHRVRANAVESLGALLKTEEKHKLLPSLEDSHNRVVGNAIMALYPHFEEKAGRCLRALSESSILNEQLTAVYCLGAIGKDNYLGNCEYLLESRYSEVKEKMIKVLEDLSQDSSIAVRHLRQWNLRMASFIPEDSQEKEVHVKEESLKEPVKWKKEELSQKSCAISEFPKNTLPQKNMPVFEPVKETSESSKNVKKHQKEQESKNFSQEKEDIAFHQFESVSSNLFAFFLLFISVSFLLRFLYISDLAWIQGPQSWMRSILVSAILYDFFFLLAFPVVFAFFLYKNLWILEKKYLRGALLGIVLFFYIVLIENFRPSGTSLFNFLGYWSAHLWMQEFEGSIQIPNLLFHLPVVILPVMMECIIITKAKVYRLFWTLLTGFIIFLSLWLSFQNQNAFSQMENVRIEKNLEMLNKQQEEVQGLISQTEMDLLAIQSKMSKMKSEKEKEILTPRFKELYSQKLRLQSSQKIIKAQIQALKEKI